MCAFVGVLLKYRFYVFCTEQCNMIILDKTTKCTFSKCYNFLCLLHVLKPRIDEYVLTHSSTYKTAYTDACKTHHTNLYMHLSSLR